MAPWLVEAIGYVGTGFALSSYATRSHRALCTTVAIGMVFLAVHYWLIDAVTIAALCLFAAVRSYVAPDVARQPPGLRWTLTAVALAMVAVLGVLTWQAWHSAIAIAGTALLVLFNFHLKDRPFRLSLLLVEVIFAANALAVGSTPGLALALAGFTLNVVVLTIPARRTLQQ